MYIAPALVASALALPASAFLVPLEVSNAAEQAKAELGALLARPARTVDLDCPGCPFFGAEDTTEPQYGVENKIHLEFDFDPQQGLTINSLPILPSDSSNAAVPYIISAPQIREEDGQQTDPVRLDFAWERLLPVTSADERDTYILPIRFTILGLQGHPVKVDTIAIDLLQTPEQTSIVKISSIPFEDTPGAETCDTSSKWSLCRLRAIIAARLQAIMEAAKARARAAQGWMKKGKGCGGRKFGAHGMHHGHGHGHHMGGHHHRAHRLGRMVHQTLRFFVIPALLGVIGGLMASAVGMLVGQLISYLWIRFHRNGPRGTRNIRVVELVVDEEEKDGLIVDDRDLPAPPQYEDVEATAVEEEKH
ncbi:uncharacterized protein Z518_00340 [Rhinocladiella mackenziei CBS 650.93]|uniref:Rhinocladiella mackenziei CBS 650.93 unplaced genomic scaffold supercont1.1, whole genome shotgun sequence n=1 Tax=Rhinocladiella mackenziei CBS 650.93 TaxID=1442369 RepID=A0A0D2J0P8_9EURO|nr:uncharacterized protein Z518_00340 [Rhinocladiella mackenziei CBS 650.93]KIX09261.1 hypothetical protein Z518_00340 [Rhinocladiella mackenziei CBS 650.93]